MTRKTITEAERLRHPCPKCHARPGEPCTDPLRDATPRCHRVRGPGQLEAHAAKEADRNNARTVASYGPLFADLAAAEVQPLTASDVLERNRRAATHAFDAERGPTGLALLRQCNKGMEWIRLRAMARTLEELAGDVGREAAEQMIRTYPLDFQVMMFREVFTTTTRKEWGPYRVPTDTKLGFRIAFRHVWEPAAPLMTVAEFNARFPLDHYQGVKDAPEPDDGGLFDRTIGAIQAANEFRNSSPNSCN